MSPEKRIPARPFIRGTVDKNRKKYDREVDKAATAVFTRGASPKPELALIGETVRGDIIKRIQNKEFAPNAERTLAGKRGGDTPLVNFGQLIGSITSVVDA